jgi:hypothetical protein
MSAAIGVADRETVAGYARELEAKGFIVARRRGGFNMKWPTDAPRSGR